MTSLIDVIFLLLLFFMLSSTFTRFSEVELTAGKAGSGDMAENPVFVRLAPESLSLNGREVGLDGLAGALREGDGATRTVLVSPGAAVTAQRLTDLLIVLRRVPGLSVTVLGRE